VAVESLLIEEASMAFSLAVAVWVSPKAATKAKNVSDFSVFIVCW
jgi:hypothetical protein